MRKSRTRIMRGEAIRKVRPLDLTPRTELVRRLLVEMIQLGEYRELTQLPSEDALAQKLGVSRVTIRAVLGVLESSGMVVRKHGAGTFILRQAAEVRTRIDTWYPFAQMIREAGYVPSLRIVREELISATAEKAARLKVPEGTALVAFHKVFLANDRPAAYVVDTMTEALLNHQTELAQQDMFALLNRVMGRRLSYGIADLEPLVAGKDLARVLQCSAGQPLLLLDATVYDEWESPLMLAQEYYVPSVITFKAVRRFSFPDTTAP